MKTNNEGGGGEKGGGFEFALWEEIPFLSKRVFVKG